MFLGGFPPQPDKATAYKKLKTHMTIVGACVVVIRVAPYVLHFLSQEKEELKLQL